MDNNESGKSKQQNVSPKMMEATIMLAQNLLQSEPFLRYKEAENKLQKDKVAQKLLTDFPAARERIRGQQFSGTFSESDLVKLQELQEAVSTNEVIQSHELSQREAIALVREVNEEISNLIGIDFSALARHSSGCC